MVNIRERRSFREKMFRERCSLSENLCSKRKADSLRQLGAEQR